MNVRLRKTLLNIFDVIHPILKPEKVQLFLRRIGVKFPFIDFASKLDYRGIVDFTVNDKNLKLRSNNNLIDIYIFWYGIFGVWEPTQLRLWSSLVKDADTILDVGANTGVYSLIASSNEKANVYAFEPVPVVREMLKENLDLNNLNQVMIVPVIVGDRIGQETIYIPWQGWTDVASINKEFAEKFVREDKMQEIVCEMTSLDSFLEFSKVPMNAKILCKIDVEGAEKRVLNGMKESLINRNISFTAELLDSDFYDEVVSMLPSGYKVYAINESSKKVELCNAFVSTASNYYITRKNDLPSLA